jgi:heme exporter protein C
LHQGASISFSSGTSMEATMVEALVVMIFAFWMYTIAVVLARVRCEILEAERDTEWVAAELGKAR